MNALIVYKFGDYYNPLKYLFWLSIFTVKQLIFYKSVRVNKGLNLISPPYIIILGRDYRFH